MEKNEFTIDCWAFFGIVDWSMSIEKNITGENLVSNQYIEKLQPIYIVEQFKC